MTPGFPSLSPAPNPPYRIEGGSTRQQDGDDFTRGIIALRARRGAAAVGYFTASLRAVASSSGFAHLAETYRLMGRPENARGAALLALADDPSLGMAWSVCGALQGERGNHEAGAALFRRTLAIGGGEPPLAPSALRCLVDCLSNLGHADEAERIGRDAIEENATNPMAHLALSDALRYRGQADEAIEEAKLGVELAPYLGIAHVVLAEAEAQAGHGRKALAAIEEAAKVAPALSVIWRIKSSFLLAKGDYTRASEAAKTALEVSMGGDIDLINSVLAKALARSRHNQESLVAFNASVEAAKEIGRAAHETEMHRLELMLEMGVRDDETGLAELDDIACRYPGFIYAIAARADLKKFHPDDPDIALMENALEDTKEQRLMDRAGLLFALGKAYLDCGDGERAFAYLDEGNRLRRSRANYDESTNLSDYERLVGGSPADPHGPAALPPTNGPNPVFVLGMPRSGTSLTEQILASHPQVTGAGELMAMPNISTRMLAKLGDASRFDEMAPELVTNFSQFYRNRIAELANGRPFVIDKTPDNHRNIGLIRLLLPEAKIIHCRRDPLDTCLSCYSKNFTWLPHTFDQGELGRYYRIYERFMEHWRSIVPASAMIEIDYEDTVADIESQTRRLLDFLGLPWDEACLSFHETKRLVKTASTRQVKRPLYSSSVGYSRRYEKHLHALIRALNGEDVKSHSPLTANSHH